MSGLFTVLIAEKEHIDAIRQENKLFFEPFLENKELAFCYWNPLGQTLTESVPGLLDVVGRKKDWRVVVVQPNTDESLKMQNPFDVVDYSDVNALLLPSNQPKSELQWEEWERSWITYYEAYAKVKEEVYQAALANPLQRLATWLCFRPEDYVLNDVREKQDVYDWAMSELGRDGNKPSAVLELLEKQQYKRELRLKETLRRDFVAQHSLNISYPAEVHCVSLRTAENSFFDPDFFWNIRQENEYSAFADRNMYFDKMRFMVFDLLPRTHRNFRTDYIRFLATVLIFASNQTPSSVMKPRRLYRLEVDTDDTPLCTLVTSYDKKLEATLETINNEMEKIRSETPGKFSDKMAESLFCTSKDVTVLLDESSDSQKLFAEKNYGLFFDHPENELYKWNRGYRDAQEALVYIVKQRIRSVLKSARQTRASEEVADVNINRLTPLQIEDVCDYTNNAENEMVASIPPNPTDASAYTKRMNEEAEAVKKILGRRMTKKTTLILSLICLGFYFACFLPFLFANKSTPETLTTAITFTGILVGLLAVVLLVSLFFLRESVLDAVKRYNNAVFEIVSDIQGTLKQFSKYLSAFCNVRRGHAIQNFARNNLDEYTKSLRIRKKHQEDIRKKRAFLKEGYGDYMGDRSFCDEMMSRPYDYDFDQYAEYDYPAPFLAGDCRQIEFMSNGNFVTVPSSYVTGIMVRMEGIYEK